MTVFWVVARCLLPPSSGPIIALMMEAASMSEMSVNCELLPDYVVHQPRRQPSAYLLPLEPQVLLILVLFELSHVFAVCFKEM
jgi:hypothetical protein